MRDSEGAAKPTAWAAGPEEPSDAFARPIDALQLSVRASNCLRLKGISTIGELVQLTEVDLLSLPNLGKTTLSEIAGAVGRIGLRLGIRGDRFACSDEAASKFPAPLVASAQQQSEVRYVSPERAILDFLGKFGERDYAVILGRIIDCNITLEQLGAEFRVTRERIRQIESRLRERLAGFLASAEAESIVDLARRVRDDFGTAVPAEYMSPHLNDSCASVGSDDHRERIKSFILWAVGPYECFGTWKIADADLPASSLEALLAVRDRRGWLSLSSTEETLLRMGIRALHHEAWMCTIGFFKMDGGWLLQLSNIPDRAEQILRYRAEPILVEELLPLVGCETVRSLRSRLLEDERFKRTTKQGHFALREWPEYDEYSGIANEIAEEIVREGGVADSQHLIEVISKRYGVKANSVHQYLSAPMFIKIEQGRVRLRAPDEMQTVRSDPRFCSGLYLVHEKWTLRVKITGETLRGSGRPLHPAVAALVGCQPAGRRVFKSPRDEIVVSWPAGSASGPNLGSLRPDVEALGGSIDDYLFLTLGTDRFGVRLLRAAVLRGVPNDVQLALMVGLTRSTSESNRWNAVASAIGLKTAPPIGPEEVHACLMRRNEVALARLIHLPDLDDPEAIFAELENTIGL